MDEQVHTDPQEVRARQNATRLMAQIEIKIHELSGMLDREADPNVRLTIKHEMAAQKWQHDMIVEDCRKKGWL